MHIPKKVKQIECDAFAGCKSIEKVFVDAKNMRNYDDSPYHRSCLLDELFPSASTFYLKHVPRGKSVFVGDLAEVVSDVKGYRKYVVNDN